MFCFLTESSLGCDKVRRFRRLALSSGVVGNDSELVLLSFDEVRYSGRSFARWYVGGVGPVWAALLLLLDDVSGDWGAAVVLGRSPFEVHVVLVPVGHLWFSRSAWLI